MKEEGLWQKSESLDPWLGQKARYHLPQREFDGKRVKELVKTNQNSPKTNQ